MQAEIVIHAVLTFFQFQLSVGTKKIRDGVRLGARRGRSRSVCFSIRWLFLVLAFILRLLVLVGLLI
jgi:hypothetical protein